MHGQDIGQFYASISTFLGSYFLLLGVMNGLVALWLWQRQHKLGQPIALAMYMLVKVVFAAIAYGGTIGIFSEFFRPSFKAAINYASGPVTYSLGTTLALVILFLGRRFFVRPDVAWIMFNVALVLMGVSMTDPNFAAIVTKPDNVPIVGLVFLLGYFTWLGTYRAVQNDERLEKGLPPLEKLDSEKVLVWAIGLKAPLEEPASSVKTPNPSKAPWYFLGLQEMLVYYDPWMAGVVLPSLVIFGLMAIPFIDFNKAGNGYYTIKERPFAYILFQIGFLELWITLIILGTFLRGPNWNFFGPFEFWDPHKVLALNNVDLSQQFWVSGLHRAMPKAPETASGAAKIGYIILRESPGILALAFYFLALPPLMATTIFRRMFVRMGFVRYMVMANLLLFMAALPIKMVLRWVFNLKYIVAIPEYFLNF
jgi:hypothetical protein